MKGVSQTELLDVKCIAGVICNRNQAYYYLHFIIMNEQILPEYNSLGVDSLLPVSKKCQHYKSPTQEE